MDAEISNVLRELDGQISLIERLVERGGNLPACLARELYVSSRNAHERMKKLSSYISKIYTNKYILKTSTRKMYSNNIDGFDIIIENIVIGFAFNAKSIYLSWSSYPLSEDGSITPGTGIYGYKSAKHAANDFIRRRIDLIRGGPLKGLRKVNDVQEDQRSISSTEGEYHRA